MYRKFDHRVGATPTSRLSLLSPSARGWGNASGVSASLKSPMDETTLTARQSRQQDRDLIVSDPICVPSAGDPLRWWGDHRLMCIRKRKHNRP